MSLMAPEVGPHFHFPPELTRGLKRTEVGSCSEVSREDEELGKCLAEEEKEEKEEEEEEEKKEDSPDHLDAEFCLQEIFLEDEGTEKRLAEEEEEEEPPAHPHRVGPRKLA